MDNRTELNKDDVQVLFADLQVELVARSKTTPPLALASSVNVLARVARLLEIPIILSVVPEGGRTPELISELAKETTGHPQFLRTGANLDERTKEALAANRRNTLIISGFATEAVVIHAATAAIARGHRVLIPVDACEDCRRERKQQPSDKLKHLGEKPHRLLRWPPHLSQISQAILDNDCSVSYSSFALHNFCLSWL